MKHILLLGSQHGNELLGDKLIAYLRVRHPELLPVIDYEIGNPKAHAANKRYIDTDLNRSYGPDTPHGYEKQRASEILKHIEQGGYRLVLDLHTTGVNQPACVITAGFDKIQGDFLAASFIDYAVVMMPTMVEQSLLGHARNAISIEVPVGAIDDKLLGSLALAISNFLQGVRLNLERKVFPISGLVSKEDITTKEAKQLVNFQKSAQGFYPILVGENSYKRFTTYLGFKADETYGVTL